MDRWVRRARAARVPLLLLGAGALLRLRQYAADRSLWHDEASLALNLVERGFAGLLEPLDYDQAAPPGFLWLVEAATRVFGTGESALRLVPLLFGLASLPLFDAVARGCLRPPGRLLALALFALSEPLVYYAAETKQYAGDVVFGLALLGLALRVAGEGADGRRLWSLGVLGGVAPWFSHASVFVLAGIGVGLGVPALRARRWGVVARLAAVGVVWTASFGVLWVLFFGDVASNPWLHRYWAFAFPPLPPTAVADLLWLPNSLLGFLGGAAGLRPPPLTLGLLAVGAVALGRTRPQAAALLGLPALAALVAAGLELYPFFHRFLLFLVPAAVVFVAQGAEQLARLLAPRSRALAVACLVVALLWPVAHAARRVFEPVRGGHIRPVLAYVAERAQPDDLLWIFWGATPQFRYYAPRLGLQRFEWVQSQHPYQRRVPRGRWRSWAEREAARLRGRGRVWLVFSTVLNVGPNSAEERMLGWVDFSAQRLDEVERPGAAAYLYHFPDGAPASPPADQSTYPGARSRSWVGPSA